MLPRWRRLQVEAELAAKNFSAWAFVRVHSSYYNEPLEARRACLGAPSVHHLCKSMIMQNTKMKGDGCPYCERVHFALPAAVHQQGLPYTQLAAQAAQPSMLRASAYAKPRTTDHRA